MKINLFAASALLALGLSATSALASTCIAGVSSTVCSEGGESVTITSVSTPFTATLTAPGYTMIDDFDSISPASGYSVTGADIFGTSTSIAAAPPGDSTSFDAVQPGAPLTLTDNKGSLTEVSFFMGSPDDYNGLSLTVNGNLGPINLAGSQIWGGSPDGTGNQALGYLVTYTFSPNTVQSLTFSSSSPAFEIDNVAGVSVPEPASWALMIMGFGMAGGLMRAKRKQAIA